MNTAVAAADDKAAMLAELQTKLELNDEQTQQMGAAMAKYAETLDKAMAKHESAEEPNPRAMIGDVKKVRDDYRKELQTFLSKEQYQGYLALVESTLQQMMSDVAQIRLLDMKEPLKLSDEQIGNLAPIIGGGLFGIVRTLFENADQNLRRPQMIRLAKSLKKMQTDMEQKINAILTHEQKKAMAAYKQAQQG